MSFYRWPMTIFFSLTLLGLTVLFVSPPAFATVGCGSTITTSVTLTSSIGPCTGDGIDIGASNIVLNCAGNAITGPASTGNGIYIPSGIRNVEVENCIVSGFNFVRYPPPPPLTKASAFLVYGSQNVFIMNTAEYNVQGFTVFGSHNAFISNTADYNGITGFNVTGNGNSFIGNTANFNGWGFRVLGSGNILAGNTADDYGNGGIIIFGSNNVVVGNKASGNAWGFVITSGTKNAFIMNTANNNVDDGFLVYGATNSIIQGNKADGNGQWGYFDYTTGSGTAGTANIYRGDECNSNGIAGSSPTGLCGPQS